MLAAHAALLAVQGFTAVACEYRLLGESPWPGMLDDVRAAIAWVRDHADELGIEPDRIALQGHSAGGHLSLLAAGTAQDDGAVAAVAALYAPVTFHVGPGRGHGTTPASSLLGDDASEDDAREASPLSHVSPDFPPTFFLHGGADRIVVPSASVVMYEALRKAGVETDLHLYAGQAHGFDRVDTMRRIVNQEIVAVLPADGLRARRDRRADRRPEPVRHDGRGRVGR